MIRRTSWGVLLVAAWVSGAVCACTSREVVTVDGGADVGTDDANTVDAFRPGRDAGPMFDVGTTARPAPIVIPSAHDGTTRLPLIVLLHGDAVTAAAQDLYLHLSAVTRTNGAYLALPTATRAMSGDLLWNDGIAFHNTPDDVAYLVSVLDQAEAMLPIDTSRVYFVGHSNGGFMAYRMACEQASRITAIVSINAGDYPFASSCSGPARPVSVLDLHGTADMIAPYDGSLGLYAGAIESTQRWATRASCDLSMAHSPAALDLDSAVSGAETIATDYVAGCTGARVSLFTMNGSGHIPGFTMASSQVLVDWLLARSAP